MKHAIVTGATGCVGRNLVDELLKDNWEVIVFHRASSDISRLNGLNVRLQQVNLYDLSEVEKAVPDNIDAIFHVAGNTSHWSKDAAQQWKDNVLATKNLVDAALTKKVKRFIFTSTGATTPYQGADEKLTNEIKQGYIRTKRLAELEIYKGINKGLDAVILQPIIVIGAYDYNSYAQLFVDIKSGKLNKAFPGRIAFCHARDVARAHIQAFEKGRCHESYMLGGTYTTWLEAFQKIANAVGVPPTEKIIPRGILKAVSYVTVLISFFTRKKPKLSPELVDLLHDAPDVSYTEMRKVKEVLGYESASLDEMIQDYYNWASNEVLI